MKQNSVISIKEAVYWPGYSNHIRDFPIPVGYGRDVKFKADADLLERSAILEKQEYCRQ